MPTVAVPNPMDWSDSVVYAATDFNREVRDAVSFLLRPPFFFGQHTTSVTLTNGAWTIIPLQTEVVNTEGTSMHSTSTNPSRVIATHAGTWEYIGGGSFSFPGGLGNVGRHIVGLRKNGTTFIRGRTDSEAIDATTGISRNSHRFIVDMSVNDYVELVMWQETGAAQATFINPDTNGYLIAKWRSL